MKNFVREVNIGVFVQGSMDGCGLQVGCNRL